MTKLELCENRCENCDKVDRGYDEYSHQIHFISERCPLYTLMTLYQKVNRRSHAIEWSTTLTGCNHFVLDEEYKKQNEEIEKLITEMNEQRKTGSESK